ncbi:hypothetical protein D3C74_329700 [compost metagenome]
MGRAHLADGRRVPRGEQGERGQEGELGPDERRLVGTHGRRDARAREQGTHRLDRLEGHVARREVDLDERAAVHDLSRGDARRLDPDRRRHDALGAVAGSQHVQVLDAVEERHDDPVPEDLPGDEVQGVRQAGLLDRDEKHVDGGPEVRRRPDGDVEVPEQPAPDPEAVLVQRLGRRLTSDEPHVVARTAQQRADEPSDPTGAQDRDARPVRALRLVHDPCHVLSHHGLPRPDDRGPRRTRRGVSLARGAVPGGVRVVTTRRRRARRGHPALASRRGRTGRACAA